MSIKLQRMFAPGLAGLLIALVLLSNLLPHAAAAQADPPEAEAAVRIALGTYYGGSSADYIYGMAVDTTGIYVTGKTYSSNLPGVGTDLNSSNDMFVAKLSLDGKQLLWSILLGGRSSEQGNAIVSDGKGSVFVTGSTDSDDFPVTAGADQGAFGGFTDIVTMRLDAATGAVRWATYLGGDNLDSGNALVLDGKGNLLIAGEWAQNDALVAMYDAATGAGQWGRAFSGRSEAKANALAIDKDGNIWVTGGADITGTETDFPIVGPALRSTCGIGDVHGSCGKDAFLTKLSADGQEILYSSLLGGDYNGSEIGSGADEGRAIAIDAQGNILVAGTTFASNFPVKNAFKGTKSGADNFNDGFLTKITPDGASIVYSTYLGGQHWDEIHKLVIDQAGNLTLLGYTNSQNFPVQDAFQETLGNGVCEIGGYERWCYDTFVTQVSPSGALRWSSYLGGGLDEIGYGLALGANGSLYIAGQTESFANQGFPVTSGVFQPNKSLSNDGFIIRIGGAADPEQPAGQYKVMLPLIRK